MRTRGLSGAAASVTLAALCLGAGAQPGAQFAATPAKASIPFTEVAPILRALQMARWPVALRGLTADELSAAWPGWVAARDRDIRDRLRGGDEDSISHLLLFGTSFTRRPRASVRDLAALVVAPQAAMRALRPRIEDFAAGIRAPGNNERLRFVRDFIAARGVGVTTTGPDLIRYLESRVEAVGATTARAGRVLGARADFADQLTAFRDRGLSSDTSLLVGFGVERALERLRTDGALEAGSVRRVAIVGPGLDFTDKFEGHDFYPPQTIQPFAVIDTLNRLGLAARELEVAAFDVNPRVLQHVALARARARMGESYEIALPRSLERNWAPDLEQYWRRFGDRIGEAAGSLAAPPNAGGVEGRLVRVRPDNVLRIVPQDLNVILERVDMASVVRFDLIVATNVFLYYDVFEQAMAAANVAAMLAPNGRLLSNSQLLELPGGPLESAGAIDVTYTTLTGIGQAGDRVLAYRLSRP